MRSAGVTPGMTRFIADANVGKLARWMRVLGYDTLFFNDIDDDLLIEIAMRENRTVLTRDTRIMDRRVVSQGRLKALLVRDDDPRQQLRQVVQALHLDPRQTQFTLCLRCNVPLVARDRAEVGNLVPPYVFSTQQQYMQCPRCQRVYWRGTHWQRMSRELEGLG